MGVSIVYSSHSMSMQTCQLRLFIMGRQWDWIGAGNSLLQYAVRGMKLEARWHDFIHFVSTIPTHPLHSPPFLSSQTLQPTPSFTIFLPFFSIYHHAPLITRHSPAHSYPYPLTPFPPPSHGHAWPHKPLQISPLFLSIPHVPLCPSPCP